jgi:hypothetical protein
MYLFRIKVYKNADVTIAVAKSLFNYLLFIDSKLKIFLFLLPYFF